MLNSLVSPPFINHVEAGLRLAARLAHLKDRRPVVVAVAPTGVQVAVEIAATLEAPIGVVVIEPVAAVARDQTQASVVVAAADAGPAVVDSVCASALGIGRSRLRSLSLGALETARRRAQRYPWRTRLDGRFVILVDDGTRHTVCLIAAIRGVRRKGAAQVLLATPAKTPAIGAGLLRELDGTVAAVDTSCPSRPYDWYEDGRELSDGDALVLLTARACPWNRLQIVKRLGSNRFSRGGSFTSAAERAASDEAYVGRHAIVATPFRDASRG